MRTDTMELDPKKQNRVLAESANLDTETKAVTAFDSLEAGQESETPLYRDDPRFRELLLHFQNAKWEQCLEKIDQLLITYPEDSSLLAFRQDVEIRLRQQKNSKEQQQKDSLKRRQKLALRLFIITALVLIVILFSAGVGRYYQVTQLNQQATLTAQSLAAQYQLADSYMMAGKPAEALLLYREIQQVDPSYPDIGQKIELAEQAVTIVELYQRGTQALLEGKTDEALEIFLRVEQLHPKYKDTPQLIQKIKDEQQVTSLVNDIQKSFSQGDWGQVVHDYEAIQSLAPSAELPELREILFISYRQLLVDTAGRGDLTLEELETAENYYRRALALFPQDREHASEREELQKIAVELLANKYYLNGISLLESSNYSMEGLHESIRVLTRASNIGTSSPAITAEIEKAQLFLDSYDHLLQKRWDEAISGFERLYRKEADYANGRVKYFLYEAYIARGDILFTFADFGSAFLDYQEAEKIAWGDQGNLLRLFQVETRIASTLRRLGRAEEAAEYYHYAFEQLEYKKRLVGPGEQELRDTLTQADLAYEKGDDPEAIRLYEIAMEQEEKFYEQKTATVHEGDTLASIAFQSGTTIERLRAANQFGESMVILRDRELLIPIVSADGQ